MTGPRDDTPNFSCGGVAKTASESIALGDVLEVAGLLCDHNQSL